MELVGTYFNSPRQTIQAAMFSKQNADKLSETKDCVRQAVKKFADEVLPGIVATSEIDSVLAEIQRGEFDRFFGLIRTNAHAQGFKCFWDVVDMINFLDEATGTYWPYMTEDRRESALDHARGLAQEVLDGQILLRTVASAG